MNLRTFATVFALSLSTPVLAMATDRPLPAAVHAAPAQAGRRGAQPAPDPVQGAATGWAHARLGGKWVAQGTTRIDGVHGDVVAVTRRASITKPFRRVASTSVPVDHDTLSVNEAFATDKANVKPGQVVAVAQSKFVQDRIAQAKALIQSPQGQGAGLAVAGVVAQRLNVPVEVVVSGMALVLGTKWAASRAQQKGALAESEAVEAGAIALAKFQRQGVTGGAEPTARLTSAAVPANEEPSAHEVDAARGIVLGRLEALRADKKK